MTRANNAPWFTKAGAANSIVPISYFVSPNIFGLKGGGYGCLFSLEGIDPESHTDEDLDVRVRGVEASLRGLPQDSCLYQYTRVLAGFDLPRQAQYDNPVTESFVKDRIEFLNKTARFRRIDLHWCLTIEPDTGNPLIQKPQEHKSATDRQLFELQKAVTILETHLSDAIGLKLLGKEHAFDSSAICSIWKSGHQRPIFAQTPAWIGSSPQLPLSGIANTSASDVAMSKCFL
jgi:type IV secretion system protein VirB4